MYSHSLKWVSSQVRDKEQHKYLNKARAGICPKSDIWPRNYNILEHKEAMKKLREQSEAKNAPDHGSSQSLSKNNEGPRVTLAPVRPAMGTITSPPPGQWTTNHSTVLLMPTIFIPASDARHDNLADWPSKEELDYEGDSRVRSEVIHARMLPTPRISGNETVAWMHRSFVISEVLDDFRGEFDEVSVFMREHIIHDSEPTDEEGRLLLGSALMDLLDPVDCL